MICGLVGSDFRKRVHRRFDAQFSGHISYKFLRCIKGMGFVIYQGDFDGIFERLFSVPAKIGDSSSAGTTSEIEDSTRCICSVFKMVRQKFFSFGGIEWQKVGEIPRVKRLVLKVFSELRFSIFGK